MTAKVCIRRCTHYERDAIAQAVHELLESFGGIRSLVSAGDRVLVKPNMLSAKPPEAGVTTHPLVLEAVLREVQSAGGTALIGDSPSGAIKGIRRFWEATGFEELARKTGVELIHFEAAGSVEKSAGGNRFFISKAVFDADVIINLPKFKTHGMTLYTGAIKNLYGTIPGFQKTVFHKKYVHPAAFSRMLADLYSVIPVRIHLMDAVQGMAGNGPSTGTVKDVGLLLASEDGVALDAVAAHLMGFREGEVDSIHFAGELGLGESRLGKITVEGVPIEEAVQKDFPLPSNRMMKLIPQFLVDIFGRFLWVKPVADLEKCTGCGLCSEVCPVKAIEMKEGRPVTDYSLCINCLCCNESCPEGAIVQKKSVISRVFS